MTATRTVVFTDLTNYTARVASADREGVRKILKAHGELVTPVMERYGGRVVKNLGDSFMCVFPAATDALRAALDVQDVCGSSRELAIRLAVSTGDVEEIDGDAFGESVNLAARILAKAPAGEIWFSSGTWACMNVAEIPWESVGHFRLKGIPGDQEIFRAVPKHRAWLPAVVGGAAKTGGLVRIKPGAPQPPLPRDPVVLFEGFVPGSRDLVAAIDTLPVLDPAALWLVTYSIGPGDRNAWIEGGRGLVIGTPEALEIALREARGQDSPGSTCDTIVFEVGSRVALELAVAGLALPAVPLADVVAGYSYDLDVAGQWVNASDHPLLRIEVGSGGVAVHGCDPAVSVNGRRLSSHERVGLGGGDEIATPAGTYVFRRTEAGYAGVVLGKTGACRGLASGQAMELGRKPEEPGLALSDRRGQENLRWCSGPRAAQAEADGFTLDRALVGRRQAQVRIGDGQIQLTPLHDRCPTYVLRTGTTALERTDGVTEIRPGDLVVAGTTAIEVRTPG